jgi:3-isopropylmalate/(R)-2-methylmalate dehydratase small subunit
METRISGNVWKFGDHIDTDVMAPWKTMGLNWDQRKASVFLIRPGFLNQINPGDIIVAGRNWGCGSSREQAAENIKLLGIGAVIARSFGRIFFRNALAIGLPCIVCEEAYDAFEEGDLAEIGLSDAHISNLTRHQTVAGQPYTPDMLKIIEKGGLMSVLKERLACGA